MKAIVETGRVALYGLFFDTGKADVKPESKPALAEIVKLLNGEPSMRLLVVGHTDTVGSPQVNQELSLRRAQSVVDSLVKSLHAAVARRERSHLRPERGAFSRSWTLNRPRSSSPGRGRSRRVQL